MKKIELAELEALIATEQYTQAAPSGHGESIDQLSASVMVRQARHWPTTLTMCALTLRSGYTVVGKSACLNPADYDAEVGRRIARSDALNQLWALEGYHRLASAEQDKHRSAVNELAFLFKCGDSVEEVARHLEVPVARVKEHLEHLRAQLLQPADEHAEAERARELRMRGLAYSDIAEVLGMTTEEVREMLVSYGGSA